MKNIFWIGVCAILASCSMIDPCGSDKQAYMESWEKLVKDAAKEADKSNPDFSQLDRRFEKLSDECHNRWEEDLSIEDNLAITKHSIEYKAYKVGSKKLKDLFN